jgi:hypothetical protein
MALYQDPAKPRPRPSLVRDLLTIPAKVDNHQIENQATCVLAWLVDRSPVFARALLELFAGDALPIVEPVGARTWISVPKPGGGAVFPDLSIEGADASFQLLVEVKVGSDFHAFELPDGDSALQPAFYRHAWTQAPSGPKAGCNAVGTLTRQGGDTPFRPHVLCAHDVTWSQVRDALDVLLSAGALEEPVRLVAASFLEAIRAQIRGRPTRSRRDGRLALRAQAARPRGGRARRGAHPGLDGDERRRARVRRATRAHRRRPRQAAVRPHLRQPRGVGAHAGRVARRPDRRHRTRRGRKTRGRRLRGLPGGRISPLKDTAGFWLHRELWPMADAKRDPGATAAQIADALLGTGLVRSR